MGASVSKFWYHAFLSPVIFKTVDEVQVKFWVLMSEFFSFSKFNENGQLSRQNRSPSMEGLRYWYQRLSNFVEFKQEAL